MLKQNAYICKGVPVLPVERSDPLKSCPRIMDRLIETVNVFVIVPIVDEFTVSTQLLEITFHIVVSLGRVAFFAYMPKKSMF